MWLCATFNRKTFSRITALRTHMGCCCCRCFRCRCCCCETDTSTSTVQSQKPVLSSPNAIFPSPDPDRLSSELYITTRDLSSQRRAVEKEPIVSLDEALRPFFGKIPQLAEQIAKARALFNPPPPGDRVMPDQAAALYLCSPTKDKNTVYAHLQRALASNDPTQINEWNMFLKYYFGAYDQLPNLKKDVWLVSSYDEEWAEILQKEGARVQTRMGPALISIYGGKEFLHRNFGPKLIIVRLRGDFKNMAGYIIDGVRQTILPPGVDIRSFQKPDKLQNETMVFHWRVVNGTEKQQSNEHFLCPIEACHHRCKRQHEPDKRCNGCILLSHVCDHHCHNEHCKALVKCSYCFGIHDISRQCKKCQGQFCPTCCMRTVNDPKFQD